MTATTANNNELVVVAEAAAKPTTTIRRFVGNQIPSEILNDPNLALAIKPLPGNYSFEIHKTIWRLRNENVSRLALQFPEGLLLYATTLTVVESRQQVGELKELVKICMEYLTALRLELTNKQTTEPKRKIELAAYFTHCTLSPAHTLLSLRSAMTMAYKFKLLRSAGSFARRLLEPETLHRRRADPVRERAEIRGLLRPLALRLRRLELAPQLRHKTRNRS